MGQDATTVRQDWTFDVVAACQRAIARLTCPHTEVFRDALVHLAAEIPSPASDVEEFWLRDRVRVLALSAGYEFDRVFHEAFEYADCSGEFIRELVARLSDGGWRNRSFDVRHLLCDWASQYVDTFERHHPLPVDVQAARILRRTFAERLNVERLNRELGCSRSALLAAFRERFGVSIREYVTLVRLREACSLLTTTSWSVEAIALTVGYQSPKNLYSSFRKIVGIVPTDVRRMDATALVALLSGALRLPGPEFTP